MLRGLYERSLDRPEVVQVSSVKLKMLLTPLTVGRIPSAAPLGWRIPQPSHCHPTCLHGHLAVAVAMGIGKRVPADEGKCNDRPESSPLVSSLPFLGDSPQDGKIGGYGRLCPVEGNGMPWMMINELYINEL